MDEPLVVVLDVTMRSGELVTMVARERRWLGLRGWRFRCHGCGTGGWAPYRWLSNIVKVHSRWHHDHPGHTGWSHGREENR